MEKLGGAKFSGPMIIPSISVLFPNSISDSRNLGFFEEMTDFTSGAENALGVPGIS